MITLYDVSSKDPTQTWSPNVWKIRYILNFKNIPHKIIPVEYQFIEPTLKEAGLEPVGKRKDGSDLYTVPAIIDSDTGVKISDSLRIALYIEETYPNTLSIFPNNTAALQQAFFSHFSSSIAPIWTTIFPRIPALLDGKSKEWFIDLRGKTFGKPLEEVDPVGKERGELFEKMKEVFSTFDGFYQANGGGNFIMGDTPGFADFMIAGAIQGLKVWGEGSAEWKDFQTWNEGRWVQLLKDLEMYEGDGGP